MECVCVRVRVAPITAASKQQPTAQSVQVFPHGMHTCLRFFHFCRLFGSFGPTVLMGNSSKTNSDGTLSPCHCGRSNFRGHGSYPSSVGTTLRTRITILCVCVIVVLDLSLHARACGDLMRVHAVTDAADARDGLTSAPVRVCASMRAYVCVSVRLFHAYKIEFIVKTPDAGSASSAEAAEAAAAARSSGTAAACLAFAIQKSYLNNVLPCFSYVFYMYM